MVKFVDRHGRGYQVSVWDSVLPRANRPAVRLIQTGDRKATDTASIPAEEEGGKKGKMAKEKGKKRATPSTRKVSGRVKPSKASSGLGSWTEKHDAQLLKMKDKEGKKWLDIVVSMGKPKKSLVERYSELKAMPSSETLASSSSSNDGSSQTSTTPAESWAEELDEDNWSATDPTDWVVDEEPDPVMLEIEDKDLTMSEMRLAIRLHDYLEEQKWLFLASKLFDKTGKRFTPEALKRGLAED